jgi:hypothetical protein
MTNREDLQAQIDALLPKAESGDDWAEICRLEAILNDGPWFCSTCGVELSPADTLPCRDAPCPIAA